MTTKEITARFVWQGAAEIAARRILQHEMSGKIAIALILAAWPEIVYSILKKFSVCNYSKAQFLKLPYLEQANLATPEYALKKFISEVERYLKIMNHLLQSGERQKAQA